VTTVAGVAAASVFWVCEQAPPIPIASSAGQTWRLILKTREGCDQWR
jgi:hypothetical protein